jgi:Domain of unknown function (DUF4388)
MPAIKLLLVASAGEIDRLRRAADAAGATAMGALTHEDLVSATAALGPDAIIVASGESLPDALATVRRLRAAAGADIPIVFAGEAQAGPEIVALVQADFTRPVAAETLVARAMTLALRGPGAAPELLAAGSSGRLRMAASLDEALEAELVRAVEDPGTPAALSSGQLLAAGGIRSSELLAGPALEPLAVSLPDLFLWADLAFSDEHGSPGWSADPVPVSDSAGDLADVDLPMLLGRLFVAGTTGRLVVSRGDVETNVYVEAGRPVLATSTNPEDRLIEVLAREGRVTAAQHRLCRQAAAEGGRKMGALLVDLGVIASSDLLSVVRQHYEELVLSLFSWSEGTWRVEPGVLASPARIRLLRHPGALVREGLRRGDQARIWRRLGSRRNVFALDLRGGAADVIAAVAGDEAEKGVLLLFDGVRSLEEVAILAAVPEGAVAEIALCGWVLGLLKTAPSVAELRASFPVRDRDLERERILGRHALAADGDYFQVLGLSRRASATEVRRAHALICYQLSPQALGPELASALAGELALIREVLEEALRVLGTEPLRARYQAALPPEPSLDRDPPGPGRRPWPGPGWPSKMA